MKPDDSMPFFGTIFFEAIEGYSDAVAVGYMRALWHYWNHTHCQGLPDDDEYLRRVCRCEPQAWVKTKGVVFDNRFFFCKNGTHWHQKNAKALHARELEIYTQRVARAENARSHINTDQSSNISPAQGIRAEKELERVEAKIEEIKGQASKTSMGLIYTPGQKALMQEMTQRRKVLLKQLGFAA